MINLTSSVSDGVGVTSSHLYLATLIAIHTHPLEDFGNVFYGRVCILKGLATFNIVPFQYVIRTF